MPKIDAPRYVGSNLRNLGGVTAKAEPWNGVPGWAEVQPPMATLFFDFAGEGAR